MLKNYIIPRIMVIMVYSFINDNYINLRMAIKIIPLLLKYYYYTYFINLKINNFKFIKYIHFKKLNYHHLLYSIHKYTFLN